MTALSHLAGYLFLSSPWHTVLGGPIAFVQALTLEVGFALFGALIALPFALPLGVAGGLLFRFLAKRTLSTA